jgi:hypothetical protein
MMCEGNNIWPGDGLEFEAYTDGTLNVVAGEGIQIRNGVSVDKEWLHDFVRECISVELQELGDWVQEKRPESDIGYLIYKRGQQLHMEGRRDVLG